MDVLDHPSFAEIKNFILQNLKNYRDDVIRPKYDMKLVITESWLNYTNYNQQHHFHKHNNSYLSGVFYINTIENDGIKFFNDGGGLFNMFDIESEDLHTYNAPSWELPVSTGQLLLFPSDLQHGVKVNKENKTRISLSFNTFLKGQISSKRTVGLKI